MTYHNAVKYILNAPDKNGPASSYDRLRLLSGLLGSPENKLNYIRFAGSNGKSVCQTMLSRILIESKVHIGSLLMPTTTEPRENILIDGEPISIEDTVSYVEAIVAAVNTVKSRLERGDTEGLPESIATKKIDIRPTKSETILLMALLAFRSSCCPLCLIECDEGDVDATKFLAPAPYTVICGTIPDDDTSELRKIKSYIKSGISEIISAPQDSRAYKTISSACAAIGCRFSMPVRSSLEIVRMTLKGSEFVYREKGYKIRLCGRFQVHNATTVIEAVRALERAGYEIGYDAVCRGLAGGSIKNKFEAISIMPTIIADSTHKTEAVATMSETLSDFKEQTGSDVVLCIPYDMPLIETYLKNFEESGYKLRELIVITDDPLNTDIYLDDPDIPVTMPVSHKAAAKFIINSAKEYGFVLITGDSGTASRLRYEVLRLLEG